MTTTRWKKSSFSSAGNGCVIVRLHNGTPQIGDSKLDITPTITVPDFSKFVASLKQQG